MAAPYPVASPLLFLTWIPYVGCYTTKSFIGSFSTDILRWWLHVYLLLLACLLYFGCFAQLLHFVAPFNIHDCSLPHDYIGLFLAYIYTFGRFLYNTAATILFFLPYSCYNFE